MKEEIKYDPEDIESLLQHKNFSELYPEEKSFVLKHISNEEEYENLRTTLLEIQSIHSDQEWFDPDPQLKEELMASFAAENRNGFRIWLNTLFRAPELPFYRRPAYQLAFGLALLIGGVLFFQSNKKEETLFAEQKTQAPSNSTDAAKADKPMTEVEVTPELKALSSPTPLPEKPSAFPQAPSTLNVAEDVDNVKYVPATEKIMADAVAEESVAESVESTDDAPNVETKDQEETSPNTYFNSSTSAPVTLNLESMSQVEVASKAKGNFSNNISSNSAGAYPDLLDALYTAR